MLEIPQDSFRLYFRDVSGAFKWHKMFQGDIICDKDLILEFLGHAISHSLIWTMDHFNVFYKNYTSYEFKTPTEAQMLRAIDSAEQRVIQKISEPGLPFQVFFKPVGHNKWILMPEYNCIVCDLNYINDLTCYGLEKGALSNLDRFDIFYKNSNELPEKVDIDSLVNEIRKQAGKG